MNHSHTKSLLFTDVEVSQAERISILQTELTAARKEIEALRKFIKTLGTGHDDEDIDAAIEKERE
jgi:hypothetical protein